MCYLFFMIKSEEHLGTNVAIAREARGMSRAQLADRCEVDRRHIWKIERGHKRPSLGLLIKLSDSLGVSMDGLVQKNLAVDVFSC